VGNRQSRAHHGVSSLTEGRVCRLGHTDYTEAQLREIRKKVTMVFQAARCSIRSRLARHSLFLAAARIRRAQQEEDVVDGPLHGSPVAVKDAYPATYLRFTKRRRHRRALAAQPDAFSTTNPPHGGPHHVDILAELMLKLNAIWG